MQDDRPLKPALIRGLKLRCPNCGEGPLLHSYLKTHDGCSECGEDFTPARADDGPAYVTIMIVGHLVGIALHIMWSLMRPSPLVMALTISTIAIVGALLLLPRVKGFIINYQWAKRMFGFDQSMDKAVPDETPKTA